MKTNDIISMPLISFGFYLFFYFDVFLSVYIYFLMASGRHDCLGETLRLSTFFGYFQLFSVEFCKKRA